MQILLIMLFVFVSASLFVLSVWPKETPDIKDMYGRHKGRQGLLLLVSPLIEKLATYNSRIKNERVEKYRGKIAKRLLSAGDTTGITPDQFIGLQEITGFLVPVVGFWLILNLGLGNMLVSGVMKFLTFPMLVLAGAYFPIMSLNDKLAKRQKIIIRSLPYSLDLLTVAIEAGLDFGAAVARLIEKNRDEPLMQEFFLMLQEIRMGKTRREALRDLAERVDIEDLTSIISSLIQADELGTGLGPILRIQSDQLRVKRTQRAEKLAGEAPVKMLLPLLGCIFPAVFIMLFGPVVIQFMESGF